MLIGLTLLLLFQLLGEVLTLWLQLPIPGPVVGMLLLFISLLIRGGLPESLESCAKQILAYLSLLFVPAGVGVMIHFERIGSEWLPIAVALLVSTVVTLVVTALVMKGLMLWLQRG